MANFLASTWDSSLDSVVVEGNFHHDSIIVVKILTEVDPLQNTAGGRVGPQLVPQRHVPESSDLVAGPRHTASPAAIDDHDPVLPEKANSPLVVQRRVELAAFLSGFVSLTLKHSSFFAVAIVVERDLQALRNGGRHNVVNADGDAVRDRHRPRALLVVRKLGAGRAGLRLEEEVGRRDERDVAAHVPLRGPVGLIEPEVSSSEVSSEATTLV